jgi:hypothetical protein
MAKGTDDWNKAELLPPENHQKVGERVFTLLGEVIGDKNALGLHTKWLEHHRYSRNQYWKRTTTKVPLVSVNLLHAHKQRTKNMLTDNNPTFNLVQLGGDTSDEKYLKLQRACEYWWIEEEQQSLFESSVSNGEDYGVCIEKVIWNPTLEKNTGEVETVIVDPFQFGFYPVDCKNPDKAEAVFYYYPMTVRQARRTWPDKAEAIKPDEVFLSELGTERRELVAGSHKDSVLSQIANTIRSVFSTTANDTQDELADKVLVVECWVKDYSRVENADGSTQYKYPGNIRCVTTCCSGKVVLSDRPNPSINPDLPIDFAMESYLWDRWPFTLVVSVKDTSTAWGMSDVEQLEQLSKEFNKAMSQMVFLKDKSARPKIVNPKTSGVPNEHFTNAPGIINPINSMEAAAIRYLDFPQVNVDIEKIAQQFKELFFLIAGTFELEQAQTPGREVIAYKAIAALLERAGTMMRGKVRNYSKLLRERGRMYLSYVQNFYVTERWFTWEEEGQAQAEQISSADASFPLKLTVVNGSTLPISKVQQREEALVLFDKGAIDQQALLDKLDWSGRSAVIERMKKGPVGEMVDKIAATGAPEPYLQVFEQLGMMDEKEFEKAVKAGEIPQIPWPGLQPDQIEQRQLTLALEEMNEKIRKERAERYLLEEKVNTERVKQEVDLAGVDYDKQDLKIKRAQTLSDIKNARKEEKAMESVKSTERRDTRERGAKSNNQKRASEGG